MADQEAQPMNDAIGIALGVVALIIICLPPKWDPAIRIKEWLER
jgi:hypothetical protein